VNEIRISGFGGQGIIRCGYIVGKTASLFDDKFATLTQSFGPEARGSACSAQVLVDKDPIRYPYLTVPDTVVCMSQEAYDKFGSHITEDGTLIIDEDLVKFEERPKCGELFAIPATRIAEQLGNRIVANIVMLGYFTAVTDILTVEAARKALPSSVPERFVDLNVKAFEQGYEYGLAVTGELPEGDEKTGAGKPEAREGTPPKPAKAAGRPRGKKAAGAAKPKKPRGTKAATKAKPKKAAAPAKKTKAAVRKAAARPRAKGGAGKAAKRKTAKTVGKPKRRSKPRSRKK
jgi:2-oxoglutarate ferredoxin oxidoreductase subunit gamma